MANLSKIKREQLLIEIEKLKTKLDANDFESLNTLNKLKQEITNKKYGLVWEEHSEKVDEMLVDNIPVFTEDKTREIVSDSSLPYNFLLEGDNLHSLKLLEKTHKGKIDVIYIDPPYNTCNSLTYDDSRVGLDDSFRHSKWLSFMNLRLQIAKKLLNESGIIMLSIDDNEAYQLKLLLDDIFGDNNLMGIFAVVKAEGGGMAKYVVKGHDLLFVYAKNLQRAHPLAKEKDIRGNRIFINNIEYWIQEDAIRETFGKYGNLYYEDIVDKKGKDFKEKIDDGIKNNEYILLSKPNGKHIIGKLRRIDKDYSKFYSVMKHLNADGVTTLKSLGLAEYFDYPKPVSLLKEIIKGATFFSDHVPIILDFFAGSGTTAQAVMELNNEDKKQRVFILCTNNEVSAKLKLKFMQSLGYLEDYKPNVQNTDNAIENKIYSLFTDGKEGFLRLVDNNRIKYESFGICQYVTYVRLKKIIEGYTSKIPESKIIYDKKISVNNFDKTSDFKQDIDKIIQKQEYSNYKIKITSDNRVQLIASTKDYKIYNGIPANLKYYKTDFIPKNSNQNQSSQNQTTLDPTSGVNEITLCDKLQDHIKELIQLETHHNIDDDYYKMILNDADLSNLITNINKNPNLKEIYISSTILLDSNQKQILESKNIKVSEIPDYYFSNELKENGELW